MKKGGEIYIETSNFSSFNQKRKTETFKNKKYVDHYGFSFKFCSVDINPNTSAVSICLCLYSQPAARVFGGAVHAEIYLVDGD